jgi:tRNA(adenine34) deaminase
LKDNDKVKNEDFFMRQALAEAKKAQKEGEVPVGAVVVSRGKIIGRGHNQPLKRNDPTAHAEVTAIRRASLASKNYRLVDCELYVTLEPCAMCLGAVVQARIRKLIFGAEDPKAGAVRSIMRFPFARTNHRPEVKGGVLAEECGNVLRNFFKSKRK